MSSGILHKIEEGSCNLVKTPVLQDETNIRVNIFIPTSLRFYGGGEKLLILLSSRLNKIGFSTTIFGDKEYSGIKRVDDLGKDKFGITYIEIGMVQNHGIGKILYHSFPSSESLKNSKLNLIMIWRVPSLRQIKACTDSDSKCIFLLHGIGIDRFHLNNLLVILYQVYMRLQFFIKRPFLSNPNLYYQVINDFQYRFFSKLSKSPKGVFFIRNALRSDSFTVGKNDKEFKVIFVGRTENLQKGIKRLLKVARILAVKRPSLKIEIIGSGTYSPKIRDTKNLSYLGFISDELKLMALKDANLLVSTSNMDPSPAVIVEALLSGLPVVGTNVSGISDTLRMSTLYGTVSSFAPRDISDCIIRNFDLWEADKDAYFSQKIERRNLALKDFSFEKMIDGYSDMLKKVSFGDSE